MNALLMRAATVLIAVLLSGCTSTKLTTVWLAPERPLPEIKKVLIIAVAKISENRLLAERRFAKGFESYGIEATASIDIMAPHEKLAKEEVKAAIEGKGIDSVVVIQLLGIDATTRRAPGGKVLIIDGGYYGSYHSAYVVNMAPVALETYADITLVTKLFNVASEGAYWTAQTKTFAPDTASQLVGGLTTAILKQMAKDGVIADQAGSG